MLAQGTGANEGPALPLFWICLLTQACLISWEALAGSLPAEAWVVWEHLRGEEELATAPLATAGRAGNSSET